MSSQQQGLFDREVDFYGLLNLPQNATSEQIQKKFRKLSLYTHPDKTMGRESHELFIQMQKAYGYLTNPTTRLIYDRYGMTGLKVYEMYADDFTELSEELRSIDIEEPQKKKIQDSILRKSSNLIRTHIKSQIQNQYKKQYMLELGVNMKTFANNYHQFYYAGHLGRSFRLIRAKSLISTVNFSLPLPLKNNYLEFLLMTQNDLKKGLGICTWKVGHVYEYSQSLGFKHSLNVKDQDTTYHAEIAKKFLNNQFLVKFRGTFQKNMLMPSIQFSSSQLNPYIIDGGYNFGNNQMSVGFKKDFHGTNLGYSCHLNIGEENFSLNPSILYQVSNDITLSASVSVSQSGQFTNQVGISYNLTSSKGASLFFQSSFENIRTLSSTQLIVAYNHHGYLFKVPVLLCDQIENKSGLLFTAGLVIAANLAMFFGFKKLKSIKTKQKKKENDIAFGKYQTKSDNVNSYLRDNQIFYHSSFNNENKIRGLVIIEAYYGLADYIYQVEAGLLLFRIPETSSEYSNQQLLPVTKQLQLQVQNSQLIIYDDFESLRGIFNPCINQRSKKLLYLRFKYRDLEKVVIYDFSRRELVIPRDAI